MSKELTAVELFDAFQTWAKNLKVSQYQDMMKDLLAALRSGAGQPNDVFEDTMKGFKAKWQPIIDAANRKVRGTEKRKATLQARKAVAQ